MSVIKLTNASKLYGFGDATTVALDEIDLEVQRGEFVAIMGPSGSGKSTLLNILGLLDHPTHGVYVLSNRDVARLRSTKRAKIRRDTVGFVFQSFNLLPRMNVLENVALPLAYKGISQSRRLKQAAAMLDRVGLADREYFLPSQLSGGQTQRVAIARALVNNPSLIIADEPTGNLDSASSQLVMELLSDVHKTGHTILMVTHNPELTRYASRVVFMHDGAIVADEASAIGKIPTRVRKTMYSVPGTTEEDDLAGVSSLMKALPGKVVKKIKKKPKKAKAKSKPNKRKYTSRSKTKVKKTTQKAKTTKGTTK